MFVFPNQAAFLAHQEHLKDLFREAEKERIIKQIKAGWERRRHLYGRILAGLGCRLAAWGLRLQERYGPVTASPVLGTANHTR